ncbi:hypothetical protein IHC87_17410 [Photobacterium damselae subsp. damselae]|uniref:hypothetical protein n=1 Tax=Photobacterium damselae TaxID=38293 RepID=UPI001F274A83|nr:hypothetical protein [Photobacterium damselae]UJZ96346.1 hypothetical protein IHC87_17410 [Photobacterium damselae subsp. damselae]UJZ99749.1 hypothetical protein IHC88_20080 [Photobacterium damselae subsp. damselae]UKA12679.1 hypothetical protein IHC91_17380 [Photobacterium damselae subsp. damselae]
MAEIFAPSMGQAIYNGTSGNLSTAVGFAKLKATPENSMVHLLDLPIGVEILWVDIVTKGLGAGVKLDVKAGNAELVVEQEAATNMASHNIVAPVYISEHNTRLDIVTKGASATGELHVFLTYRFIGY